MADTLQVPKSLEVQMLEIPRKVDEIVLGAGTAESWVCPSGTNAVIISATAGVFVRVGATAVVPTTETTDGTGSLYINSTAQFRVEQGVTYSFIRATGSSTTVTIGRYS